MIYIFLANGFEEVEAVTPIDYLRRCEELDVKTVSVNAKMVTGSHGLTIVADMTIDELDLSNAEMIVLPGGMPGTINLEKSPKLKAVIEHCNNKKITIGAICAAPSILGHMGLLNGKKATCYSGFEQELFGANVLKDEVVVDGNIITARGAGVANQFSFELIKALLGEKKVSKIKASVLWEEN